jgi:Acetyltransferases
MLIRELNRDEFATAIELAWEVFKEYEAPEYSEQGIQEFYASIHDAQFLSRLRIYGAIEGNDIVGVIATRNNGSHIALFFVNGKYHKQGIGTSLFKYVYGNYHSTITVNSSPYAIPVYQHLGFKEVDTEKVTNGLRYTPMECKL